MNYTITPAPTTGDVLLRFTPACPAPELRRASALARALRGRYVPGCAGFRLTPYAAERWSLLFAAGFDAAKRTTFAQGSHWRLFLGNDPGVCLNQAMHRARAMQRGAA